MKKLISKLRFLIAMAAGKCAALGLRLLGRNATYLPGLIALKLCPDLLGQLKKPETLICVTGTNGKTTTSNFLTSVLTSTGERVTNNSFGSNVQAGVATALMVNSTLFGRHKNKTAVIEVDERSSPRIYPYITPDYLIVNNIMRDSLKRNAHTEFISWVLSTYIPASTKLILNGDDIICSSLAKQCKDRTYFGLDAERPEHTEGMRARDVVYCPVCGGALEAEYLRYNHIGRMHCTVCGYATPERDFLVTAIDRENALFTVRHDGEEKTYKLVSDNVVNVYNFCGAIALLTRLGVTYEQITGAFQNAEIVKTRYVRETVGDAGLTMILSKGQNPVAVSRVFSYVSKCDGDDKAILVMVDDKADNTNNVENTCWLYDLDYSPLKAAGIKRIVFAGRRCYDHQLRAAMTGLDPEKLVFTPEVKDSVLLLDPKAHKDLYILYDNYLLDDARREEKTLKEALAV